MYESTYYGFFDGGGEGDLCALHEIPIITSYDDDMFEDEDYNDQLLISDDGDLTDIALEALTTAAKRAMTTESLGNPGTPVPARAYAATADQPAPLRTEEEAPLRTEEAPLQTVFSWAESPQAPGSAAERARVRARVARVVARDCLLAALAHL